MTPQRINQVKKEIRILGVAAKHNTGDYTVVGAVYRGSRWLDGVMYRHSSDLTQAISEMLSHSPHKGQVRVIIVSRENLPPDTQIDVSKLYEKIGKPIILLNGDHYVATGIGKWTTEAILKTSTRDRPTPEALRVASMALSALAAAEDA